MGTRVKLILAAVAIVAVVAWAIWVVASPTTRVVGGGSAPFLQIAIGAIASLWGLAVAIAGAWRRPVPKIAQNLIAASLGVAALVAYSDGFHLGYAKFWHRHDFFQQYLGAKYFPELEYTRLYRCAIVASDEIGVFTTTDDDGRLIRIDATKEARSPTRAIRDLEDSHRLIPSTTALANPAVCKSHFSDDRWTEFKADVRFFRGETKDARDYFEGMQKDHGFHRSPAWMIGARLLTSLHASTVGFMQFLAAIDVVLLAGMFGALTWAFGLRVAGLAAVFYGCQATAASFWTGGAFLFQDGLFLGVLSLCLARKRKFVAAGAVAAYAGWVSPPLLMLALGWAAVVVITHPCGEVRRRTPPRGRRLRGE